MQIQNPDSPKLSMMPLKGHQHLDTSINAKEKTEEPGGDSTQEQRPDSPNPSCVSMKSDQSKVLSINFKNERPSPERGQQEGSGVPRDKSTQHHQTDLHLIFKILDENPGVFKNELERIFGVLSPDNPASEHQIEEMFDGEDEEQRSEIRAAFLKITEHLLRNNKQEALANHLQSMTAGGVCQGKLKSNLRNKFKFMFEGVATAGKPTLLKDIFTELFLTEGGTEEVNEEHEVIQIETTSRKAHRPETAFKLEDIFIALPGENKPIRTVMTKGVAGIGKTVLTKKFTLDWAENKTNKDILFTFPFTFRELNVLKEKKLSLVDLVYLFFPETKEAEISMFKGPQVVFIFDGLDECRLPLDFSNSEILTDVTESASVGVLLTNLIKGNLLPSARIWITTRPAAANHIPSSCVDRVTEVRGFTDEQKEDYFKKRFNDEESKVFSHIRKSPSLSIMCHIPVFCWIIATALEDVLKFRDHLMPNTLTEMYIHFLVVQSKRENVKYKGGDETDPHWTQDSRKMIETLGKLAFEQLQKGNLIFYESDLEQCDIKTFSEYSGLFTQILREERGLYQEKVFCFVHLTIQEFLAALHVHLTFTNHGVLLLSKQTWYSTWLCYILGENKEPTHFYQSAIDLALESVNRHLDLFLRFLLGLSLETNQQHIRGLLTRTEDSSQKTNETKEKTIQYIKKKLMNDNLCAEKSINLLHCLNELEDSSLVEEIQQSLKSGRLSADKLSPAQWSALVFILLSSKEDLEVFDLKKFSDSEMAFLRLLPVIKASRKALLGGCKLSKRSCEALSSVLGSPSSSLTELDLSYNNLQDEGVELLFKGLRSPHCKLKTLRLNDCKLSEKICKALALVLSLDSFNLTELDLSNNNLQDAGVEFLSEVLKSPQCKLETLSLSGCLITEVGCASLARALESKSNLRELDLSYNHPGEKGKQHLSALRANENCRLEALRMDQCGSHRLKTGLQKYACQLQLDANTVNKYLKLSDNNRTVAHVQEEQSHPDHPDRFEHWYQLLCQPELTGRCYWEVDWEGRVVVAVSHGGIERSTDSNECVFGWNHHSWSMICHNGGYIFRHANKEEEISLPLVSKRVAVYVDIPADILCFYEVTSDSLTHLRTFSTKFNGPLYPGFGPWSLKSSVSLCPLSN
ncbi:NLR family CARD domain-containing protein 3-like isoform X2 [Cheilinus undulatus]|uniref:NLR family CARD domain-containing protein 3-like isoform X2 n=1 Tax=Cheilinus undulatus TaxID=241271 RepID=UPI001BD4C4FB|nr:NLR family CARD domain-containing protein 3-like isoform X2 [Cheilinus undulatus]